MQQRSSASADSQGDSNTIEVTVRRPSTIVKPTQQATSAPAYTLHFGAYKGFTLAALVHASRFGGRSSLLPDAPASTPHPGDYLVWLASRAFTWHFPYHFYLYLALRQLDTESCAVWSERANRKVPLVVQGAAHERYADYVRSVTTPDEKEVDPYAASSTAAASGAGEDNDEEEESREGGEGGEGGGKEGGGEEGGGGSGEEGGGECSVDDGEWERLALWSPGIRFNPNYPPDVFLSVRFGEAMQEATALKQSLEARGICTFLCNETPGADLLSAISSAIDKCRLAVMLASKTYGRATNELFDTRTELSFIISEKKPFYLIKMCERWEEATTRMVLGATTMYTTWLPGRSMPEHLVDNVIAKLQSSGAIQNQVVNDNGASRATEDVPSPANAIAASTASAVISSPPQARLTPPPQQLTPSAPPQQDPHIAISPSVRFAHGQTARRMEPVNQLEESRSSFPAAEVS